MTTASLKSSLSGDDAVNSFQSKRNNLSYHFIYLPDREGGSYGR